MDHVTLPVGVWGFQINQRDQKWFVKASWMSTNRAAWMVSQVAKPQTDAKRPSATFIAETIAGDVRGCNAVGAIRSWPASVAARHRPERNI
jgi:hypothetical protein